MLKRLLFVMMLAFQAATVVSVAKADVPMPVCYPCPN